jgi:hypothetical protein
MESGAGWAKTDAEARRIASRDVARRELFRTDNGKDFV